MIPTSACTRFCLSGLNGSIMKRKNWIPLTECLVVLYKSQVRTSHSRTGRLLVTRCYQSQRMSSQFQAQGRPSAARKYQSQRMSSQFQAQGKPSAARKVPYRTAAAVGAVVIAGIFIKLKSASLDEDDRGLIEKETKSEDNDFTKEEGSLSLSEAIRQCRDLLQRKKDETGSPGLVVAVSVNGKNIWMQGLGYADVENRLPCTPQTIFRIASISKSITMTTVAKLWENGDLDLDKPVQFYVKEFPEKYWKGEKVTVTTRQLLSHMAGIRHYDKSYMKEKSASDSEKKENTKEDKSSSKKPLERDSRIKGPVRNLQAPKDEMLLEEYYISEKYSSVSDSLKLFKDDPLVNKPGTKFLYTSHGWTLVSAVVEAAAKMPFDQFLKRALDDMGLENTFLEEHQPLIYNRGRQFIGSNYSPNQVYRKYHNMKQRHYVKNDKGRLVNAPYVDLSYKWAGGGLISNVLDLTKFGNAMLYSYQARNHHTDSQKGYLKPETVDMMWTIVSRPEPNWEGVPNGGYGLGWSVWNAEKEHPYCKDQKFIVSHTGGAIGASSVLLILPSDDLVTQSDDVMKMNTNVQDNTDGLPKGIVVAIIVNMMSVGLNKTAYDISKIFQKVDLSK